MHLAVYGTLKKGFGNHRLLDPRGFRFVGTFFTKPKFHMTSAGGFPVVYKDRAEHHIEVEVYEIVDETYLSRVDQLEGHPNWYKREPVELADGSPVAKALMYMMAESPAHPSYRNIRYIGNKATWVRTHD